MSSFSFYEERLSDSPYVETVAKGRTEISSWAMRPAETNWHIVFVKLENSTYPILTGTFASAAIIPFISADILWIRFELGVFPSHLSMREHLANKETILPNGCHQSFWFYSDTVEIPTFDNADTFINRLFQNESLMYDPLINEQINHYSTQLSPRTVRHRFVQATGLSQKHIEQVQRAKQAQALLQKGHSILDTTYALGYYDQAHFTKSLKHYIGYTPSQIIEASVRDCHFLQDDRTVQTLS
jgi:AraC-like DNA-binding protein